MAAEIQRAPIDPEAEVILRQRARTLASRSRHEEERVVAYEVVVVGAGEVLLGLPIDSLAEIRRVEVTPLPSLPPSIPGVFQIRGRVLSLIEPLRMTARKSPTNALAAIVDIDGRGAGIHIDQIIGPRVLYQDERADRVREEAGGFITFVSRDLIQVVDPAALLKDSEYRVDTRTD